MKHIIHALVVALTLLAAGTASASTDINGLFDSRSLGMGTTGAGFLDSAGVIPMNPAALDQIPRFTLTVHGTLIGSQPEAPYTITHQDGAGNSYQNYESIRSSLTTATLPFIGAAYRVIDRVVVGVGAYPLIGQGTDAKYRPAPEALPKLEIVNHAAAGLLEFGIPVSVRIIEGLSVAAMWRLTYLTQTVKTAVAGGPPAGVLRDPMGNPIYGDLNVSGFDATGFQLGVFYKPLPFLRVGLSYRSKIVVDGEGKTKTKNPLSGQPIVLDTIQQFANPHQFRLGAALSVLNDKLLFAADVKYNMYAEAWKYTETTTIMNGMPNLTKTPAFWHDSVSVHLGGEYKLIDMVALRAGYVLVTSATNEKYAQQFMAPPGISHSFTGGVGVRVIDQLSIDVAGAYVNLGSRVDTPTQYNAGIGVYRARGFEAGASATLRL